MAKKKTNDKSALSLKLAKRGGKILKDTEPIKYWIDTGNFAMNYICSGRFMGGGIPGRRITEIYGPESSGKSLWATNVVRGAQVLGGIPVYMDCENSLSSEFVEKASHVDLDNVHVFTPETLEATFLKIHNIIRDIREEDKDSPIVIIYDSLSSSQPDRESRETLISENPTKTEWKRIVGAREQPGERAKIVSKELRKLNPILEKYNATLLILNQIRMKIGVLYGNPETAGVGEALKFYAGCRLRTATAKKILNKLKVSIGVNLKVVNKKNKCFRPFAESEGIQLYYDVGVDPLSGLLSILLQSERVVPDGKGVYKVAEPWAGGETVKFKANKETNRVPAEPLLACPGVVDAKDEKEVQDYLSVFDAAIQQTLSDDNEEIDVEGGDE